MTNSTKAFSLVELSIVLVILGLLVGGVLSGQSLIRAAELRTVTTDYAQFSTAVQTFRDKYIALPGDMTNATQFWGFASGTTGTDFACYHAVSTDARTCNGNGNGLIANSASPSTTATVIAQFGEFGRFWQHLANAGLISGRYTGTFTHVWPSYAAIAGTNSPTSKTRSSAYWSAGYYDPMPGGATWFATSGGNTFSIYTGPTFTGSVLNSEEAWNTDAKIDDGRPGTGKMLAEKGNATRAVTTAANVAPPGDANAQYNMQYTTRDVWFSIGF